MAYNMSVKEKALELQKSFRLRENPLHRPAVRKAAALGAHFLLGFVTGSVRILENWGPFGVAMAARAGGGLGGLMCVLGAGTGYVLSGGFDWGLRYIAALLLVYTAAFILRDSGLGRKNWFMPLAAGAGGGRNRRPGAGRGRGSGGGTGVSGGGGADHRPVGVSVCPGPGAGQPFADGGRGNAPPGRDGADPCLRPDGPGPGNRCWT